MIMKYIEDSITFQTERPAPNKDGFYYVKSKIANRTTMRIAQVCIDDEDTTYVLEMGQEEGHAIEDYRWFGEVMECREA